MFNTEVEVLKVLNANLEGIDETGINEVRFQLGRVYTQVKDKIYGLREIKKDMNLTWRRE